MGGYLSEPIKDKESADFESDRLLCGASSMQGWRENQEDAHNVCLNYDENISLFAVYDGHGGQEVAQYCEKNLPDFIKNTDAYKKQDYETALIDGFLGFDATIITPEVIKVLEQMSGRKLEGSDVEDESEENVKDLFLEAKMPLDQLVAKYRQEGAKIKFDSPALKPRKQDGAGPSTSKSDDSAISSSSSQAGCSKSEPSTSTSSSSDLTNGEVLVNGDGKHDDDSADKAENGSSKSPAKKEPEASSSGSSSKSGPGSSSKVEAASSSKVEAPSSSKSAEADSSGEPSKAAKAEVSSSSNGEVEENSKPAKRSASLTRKLLMNEDESDSDSEDVDFEGERPSDDEDDDDEGDSVAVEMGDDDDDEDDDDEDDEDEEEDEDDDDGEEDCRLSLLPEEPGMDSGCTAVVALLAGNNLFVANAGDSRCIVCRNGTAVEMSIDHKPEDKPEMDRILAAGGTVKEGRVNKGLNLSRAIGDFTYKKNEALPPTEQMIIALPDVKKLEIDAKQDEFMVLACDGIWNSMTSQEVVDFVKPKLEEGVTISKICEQMFDHCLAPNTLGDGTGCDNMTCIIVKFKDAKPNSVNSQEPAKRAASPDKEEGDRAKRQKVEEEPAATAEAASA